MEINYRPMLKVCEESLEELTSKTSALLKYSERAGKGGSPARYQKELTEISLASTAALFHLYDLQQKLELRALSGDLPSE